MATQSFLPIKIFYCYAPEDGDLRERLERHLIALRQRRDITGWFDASIQAGLDWKQQSEAHLDDADIILLLISANFMASRYGKAAEMKRTLERHRTGTAHVIPILLKPVDWKITPLGTLSPLPANGKSVTTWPNEEEALLDIAQGINRVVQEMLSKQDNSHKDRNMSSFHRGPLTGQRVPAYPSPLPASLPVQPVSSPQKGTSVQRVPVTSLRTTVPIVPPQPFHRLQKQPLLVLASILLIIALASILFYTYFPSVFGHAPYNTPLPKSDSSSPTSIQTQPVTSYPHLASSYQGTVHNTTYNLSTDMTLFSIEEDQQGNISGQMTSGAPNAPLYAKGPFTGTVSTSSSINFTVTSVAPVNGEMLTFTGTISPQNSLVGEYSYPGYRYNGTYYLAGNGTWSVAPI